MSEPVAIPKWVERIERHGGADLIAPPRSREGLEEFIRYESRGGVLPATDYGRFLLDAKKWFEWLINEYAAKFGTPDWPGFYCLGIDFADDPEIVELIRKRIRVRPKKEQP